MRLFVDGRIYEFQKKGGISRIFTEILPLMASMDESLEITLFAQAHARHLPRHARITHAPKAVAPESWPHKLRRAWDKIQRAVYFQTLNDRNGVWYSSYYTLPKAWNGPRVILVADIIHEIFPEMFPGAANDRFRDEKRRCVESADMILCISETTRQDVIRHYKIDPKKTAVAHLAQGIHFYQDQKAAAPASISKPFFLYIGTRVHYKNFEFFIRAYAAWAGRTDVDVALVGPALSTDEERLLKELKIESQVHLFLSGVNDDLLRQLYNRAAAFVYPSIYEGFGIPLLEAMACGCPVISSDIPSSREIAGDVPLYFPLADDRALKNCFDAVRDVKAMEAVKARGVAHARQYSWEKTARQTLEILKQSEALWNKRG